MRRRRLALVVHATVVTFVSMILAWPHPASSSPCRPERGFRNVEALPLDQGTLEFMQEVQFAKTATLYTGPPGIKSIQGIEAPSESYAMGVDWIRKRIVFSLQDAGGLAGSLTLSLPDEISIFEVDLLEGPDTSSSLYREWELTGKTTGTGPFEAAGDPGQRLSLILQGRGKDCIAGIADFQNWTLVMKGPKANYHLFGGLVQAR